MIYCGDCVEVMRQLKSKSVNCCITSPPYYGLRDYGEDGQIGLEETPELYVQKLVEIFREVKRVLRDDGTVWLNLGDSYAGSGKGSSTHPDASGKSKQSTNKGMLGTAAVTSVGWGEVKPKELLGIPWMVAFALRADGWYLRQDIIWHKPNPMPESVKDRCTKAHEYIFLLSKSRNYYFDHNAIMEPAVGFSTAPVDGSEGAFGPPQSRRRKGNAKTFRGGGAYTSGKAFHNDGEFERNSHGNSENETGLRARRDVWTVATRGYSGAHFATFPPTLIEPCVLAGCPSGGYVIDPFFGSGTVGVVAQKNGRGWIGIDISSDYCALAEERIKNEAGGRADNCALEEN